MKKKLLLTFFFIFNILLIADEYEYINIKEYINENNSFIEAPVDTTDYYRLSEKFIIDYNTHQKRVDSYNYNPTSLKGYPIYLKNKKRKIYKRILNNRF